MLGCPGQPLEIWSEPPVRPPVSVISHSWLEEDPTTPVATNLPSRGELPGPGSLARMSAPSTPPGGPPDPEDVFDHLRREDGEHVGYIEMSADGRFIPYDRLWVRRGEAMDLDEAEAVLDAIGLRLLAEDWLLEGRIRRRARRAGPGSGSARSTGTASSSPGRWRTCRPPASPSPWTSSTPSSCPSRRLGCAQPPERALPAGAVTRPDAAVDAQSPG